MAIRRVSNFFGWRIDPRAVEVVSSIWGHSNLGADKRNLARQSSVDHAEYSTGNLDDDCRLGDLGDGTLEGFRIDQESQRRNGRLVIVDAELELANVAGKMAGNQRRQLGPDSFVIHRNLLGSSRSTAPFKGRGPLKG